MKKILFIASMLMSLASTAQTITFDTEDYKSLGVYDTWEESPFRTGVLKGNAGITRNFLNGTDSIKGESPDQSTKMLAFQRSRYGSNTFGARIDLKETFELTTTTKYVHVMIYKPTSGRVMLVGLGKRTERAGQSPETEQFWALGTTKVQADTWTDAVFAIKGNGGIDIYSLVVVPDCESTHDLKADYLCYIDEIVVNDQSSPRFRVNGEYGINYDIDQASTRTDRQLTGIGFSVPSKTDQSITDINTGLLYNNLTDRCFWAKAGETVTPTFTYSATWMSGYVYADWDNNGKFEYDISSNGKPAAGSNIVSYAYYSPTAGTGTNSKGESVANGNVLNPPAFTIPGDLANGFYRVRYKVDWNSLDPGGNAAADNQITSNGGAIVDVMLNVHGDYCQVNDANRNGEVLSASDGAKLVSYKAAFGEPFTIRMNPERGFEYAGIRVRHGYGLAGDSLVHNNAQYRDTVFSRRLFVNDEFTIPAECMDGDVEIEGLFVEQGTLPVETKVTYNVVDNDGNVILSRTENADSGSAYPDPGLTSLCSAAYYELSPLPETLVEKHDTTITLVYTSKFPFEVTTSLKSAKWYNLYITASQCPLYYNGATKMALEPKELTDEEKRSPEYMWCFMGNAFDGFLIVSAKTHSNADMVMPDSVLTSSTNMMGTEGGNSFPVLRKYPFSENSKFSRGWFVESGNTIGGQTGFYLGHKENAANRMNSRDGYLSYWTGGAGDGSTFTVSYVGSEEELLTGISTVSGKSGYSGNAGGTGQSGDAGVYDLQGRKRNDTDLPGGIYIINGKKKLTR